MITVHHLNNSRSQRVLWLLEELELDYEVVRYERDEKTMLAPPALRKMHPLGKSPVISDGDITVAESGAIIEYLVDGPGQGRLKRRQGTAEQRRYTYWLHYAEGSAMPPLLMSLVFARIPKQPMPFFVRPIARGIADKVLANFVDPQLKAAPGLPRERAEGPRLVRRQAFHGSGHPDELPGRGPGRAWRTEEGQGQARRLARAYP